MPAGRPLKFKSPEELQKAIDDYFVNHAYMGEEGSKVFAPTVCGLAYHLDTSRQCLINYENKDEYFGIIKKAKLRIEMALEQRLFGQAVVGTIFNLKNNFGWKDKTEQELSGPNQGPIQFQNIEELTDEQLAAIAAGRS